MKTRLTKVMLCLLMLCVTAQAGEPDQPGITLWGLTSDAADSVMGLRVGYEMASRFEAGFSARQVQASTEWGPTPDFWGFYFAYHIREAAVVTDELPDNPWEEILHDLVGNPYIALESLYNSDTDEIRPNYVIGTLFTVKEDVDRKAGFVIEYSTGEVEENRLLIGFRIKF